MSAYISRDNAEGDGYLPIYYHHARRPVMGDVGRPVRHIEIEPLPETEPIHEPSPAVEPVKVPEPEPVAP